MSSMLFHVSFYYGMHIHFQFLSLPNIFSLASFWWVSLYLYPGKILCWEVIFTCSLGVIPDLCVLFAYCIFSYSFFLNFVLIFKLCFLVYSYLYSICATVSMLNSTLDILRIMMLFNCSV